MFVFGKPFHPSVMFFLVQQEPTLLKNFQELHSRVGFLALSTNNCRRWKGLSVKNTLAYYENSQITDIKSFITLGSEVLFTKPFFLLTYEWSK